MTCGLLPALDIGSLGVVVLFIVLKVAVHIEVTIKEVVRDCNVVHIKLLQVFACGWVGIEVLLLRCLDRFYFADPTTVLHLLLMHIRTNPTTSPVRHKSYRCPDVPGSPWLRVVRPCIAIIETNRIVSRCSGTAALCMLRRVLRSARRLAALVWSFETDQYRGEEIRPC